MRWVAGLFWACFLWAGVAYLTGDRAALTGVVGAGIAAIACTVLWWIEDAP